MDKTFKDLEHTLQLHAHGLGIPSGSANIFISETIKSVRTAVKDKPLITDHDLKRLVVKELKKYHKDFAYIYANCDIII